MKNHDGTYATINIKKNQKLATERVATTNYDPTNITKRDPTKKD
jgi:hypothetical protein